MMSNPLHFAHIAAYYIILVNDGAGQPERSHWRFAQMSSVDSRMMHYGWMDRIGIPRPTVGPYSEGIHPLYGMPYRSR